jgi:hypothetical protein
MTGCHSWEFSAHMGNFPRRSARSVRWSQASSRFLLTVRRLLGGAHQENLHAITGHDEYTFGRPFHDGPR